MQQLKVCRVIFLLLFLLGSVVSAQKLPQQPKPNQFILDYAHVMKKADGLATKKIQDVIYKNEHTPIVVVTIQSKADLEFEGESIERVARAIFDHWQIGKKVNGQLYNRGVLVLVSVEDRQARIELGADWGHASDDYCDQVTQSCLIRGCKRGDISGGLHDAVKQLAVMAQQGPDGSVPFSLANELQKPMVKGFNPLPRWIGISCMLSGALVMGLAFAFPKVNFGSRKEAKLSTPIFCVGGALFIFGAIYSAIIILLAIFAWLTRGRSGGGSSWGGGGFGSGGFSGGGGASGEW